MRKQQQQVTKPADDKAGPNSSLQTDAMRIMDLFCARNSGFTFLATSRGQ